MTEKVRGFLRGSKDAALAFAARTALNTRLVGIGEITELAVDTELRAFHLRLNLDGEAEPIDIHVKKYTLTRTGEEATLTIINATASRPWLTQALRQFAVGRPFKIPPTAGLVMKLLG
jgi:hypothetical protein